jgi:hypothetical protein
MYTVKNTVQYGKKQRINMERTKGPSHFIIRPEIEEQTG